MCTKPRQIAGGTHNVSVKKKEQSEEQKHPTSFFLFIDLLSFSFWQTFILYYFLAAVVDVVVTRDPLSNGRT